MESVESWTMSKDVFSFRIPFTRLRLQLVRVVMEKAQIDEVRKELIVRGLRNWFE